MATTNGVKNVLASFEKTIKENNEAGVSSGMYLSNLLTKGRTAPPASAVGTRDRRGSNPEFTRRTSASTSTTTSSSSPEVDEWTSNSSLHSGFTNTERCDDSDSSTESCDSFGDGVEGVDDWEVPSIAADINNSRSRRGPSGRLICNRRSNRHSGFIPETILENNSVSSKHDSNSGHSSKDSRNSSSTHRSSRKSCGVHVDFESDDSDADSFG